MRKNHFSRLQLSAAVPVAALLLAVSSATDAIAQRPDRSVPTTRDSIKVVNTITGLFAAAEKGDLVALDTLYAGEDLTVIEGAGINRGWKDYRDHHLGPELKEMSGFEYRPFEIQARVSGPLAWAIFRYTLKAKSGDRVVDNIGRGTAILERRGTKWVVRHTQTYSRSRRPTDPPAVK